MICGAAFIAACVDIPTGANDLLSIQIDPLPSPSVVVGDTLRDSTGVASAPTVTAYNYNGDLVVNPLVKFTAVDRGIHVDSLKGFVIGDSVRTGARLVVTVDGLSSTIPVAVTYRPDSAIGVNARDSLSYSATDTAANVSAGMGLKLVHGASRDTAVASWRVGFRIVSASNTSLARIINDNGATSTADTTDATGTATRRIKIDVTKLTALVDSVIVEAVAKYRGVNVKGSPVRLVLKLKPK
jgi:hypothetical protein